jgi:hypothetical protein
MRNALPALILTPALVLTAMSTSANQRLSVRVSPAIASAPATVRVQMSVQKHSGNRLLRVEADSGEFYRSSDIQLDGAASTATQRVEWFGLPSGTYQITATLSGAGGTIAQDRRTVTVLSGAGEFPRD